MDCLRDWVGLRWCSNQTTPDSGLWINSFPRVSFKQMQLVSDDEQKTFEGVWSDIQDRAIISHRLKLTAELGKRYKLINPKKSYNLSKVLTSTTYASGTLTRSGFTVRMYKDYPDYPESLLSSIHCQSLFFYAAASDADEEVSVYIYDLISGEELWSEEVTLAAGWNEIKVNETFHNNYSDNSLTLFCCIDSSALTTTGKTVEVNSYVTDNALVFAGATTTATSDIVDADVTEGSNSYGLSGIFSSVCSYDALVCQNKKHFTASWAYNLIVETMDEVIHTLRLNAITMNMGKEGAREIKEQYQAKLDEAIRQECETISLDLNDACLECNEMYTIQSSHP